MRARAAAAPERGRPNQAYGWYMVGVLMLAYAVSFLDRYSVSLLIEPIKRDLGLSDVGASLLHGLTFSVVFCLAGLPLGRLADRHDRMTIIALGIAAWSLMTAGCGLAGSLAGLLVCRAGVAAGEASLLPAGFSAIGDAVHPKRLGLAFAVFTMGVYLGAGLAFLLGGVLIGRLTASGGLAVPFVGLLRPWQGVFMLIGLPGLLLAGLVATLREPRRTAPAAEPVPWVEVRAFVREHRRTLTCLLLCGAFAAMGAQGVAAWVPSLLVRSFGWSVAEAGRAYGLVVIVAGIAGALVGGLSGDALAARAGNGRLAAMVLGGLCAVPFALAPLAGEPHLLLLALGGFTFSVTVVVTNSPAALQSMLPNRMHGIGASVATLVLNLVGLGLGPTAVALATDNLFGDERRLGAALALVAASALAISVGFGLAGLRPYGLSRAAAEAGRSRQGGPDAAQQP